MSVNILRGITSELSENLLRVLKILPGSFRSNIDPAVRITCPAIAIRVKVIVRIHIGSELVSVIALTVQPVLGL